MATTNRIYTDFDAARAAAAAASTPQRKMAVGVHELGKSWVVVPAARDTWGRPLADTDPHDEE